jgi:hypothetical protein
MESLDNIQTILLIIMGLFFVLWMIYLNKVICKKIVGDNNDPKIFKK